MGSELVVVTLILDLAPVLRKECPDIQVITECKLTLKHVHDMIRTYSQNHHTDKCSQHK